MDFFNQSTALSPPNSSRNSDEFSSTTAPPQWIVVIYFVLLAFGGSSNLASVLALIRTRRNGTLTLVLQIAIADLLSLYVSYSEVIALGARTWPFSRALCSLFTGAEVFANTLTVYLLVCFNFHLISAFNDRQHELKCNNERNPLTCRSDSNECLVRKQHDNHRHVTIDYRKRRRKLSTLFPALLVWFVSLSLSVPNFALSSTLTLRGSTICAIVDLYHVRLLQYSLLTFKILIPTLLMLVSFLILAVKCCKSRQKEPDNLTLSQVKGDLTRKYLVFALVYSLAYFATSFQRLISHCVHIVEYAFDQNNSINDLRMPPLYNNRYQRSVPYLAMLHYLGPTLRALLCLLLLPKFRYLLRSKLFVCFKER